MFCLVFIISVYLGKCRGYTSRAYTFLAKGPAKSLAITVEPG